MYATLCVCVRVYVCISVGVAGPQASVCLEQLSVFIYFFTLSLTRHSSPQSAKVVYYFHTPARVSGWSQWRMGEFLEGV